MKTEKTITVYAYTDKRNRPTCSSDVTTGDVCRFLRFRNLGMTPCCALGGDLVDDGWIRPGDDCPVWGGKDQ